MTGLTIERGTGRRLVRDFLEVGDRCRAGDPIYTPPLRQDLARALGDANPLWQAGRGERTLLVAYRRGQAVGRVLAHVHHASNQRHREQAGFFGFLEAGGDAQVAAALLDETAAWHRAAGRTELRGPYEITIAHCIGAVVSGFDEPATLSQSWNAPELPGLLEASGFRPCFRMTTFRLDDVAAIDPDALIGPKQREWLDNPAVRIRPFAMEHLERDLAAAIELLNVSFADNYGFVALAPEEVAFMAAPMKRVVRPELTLFIELAGRPVAVSMMLPDLNVLFRRMRGRLWPIGWAQFLAGRDAIDAAVAQFIATDPTLQNRGLMRLVLAEALRRLRQAGFRTLDGTWISDSNAASRAQALALGMREKHRLALYSKAL
jgi:GNAT superfamily N-acetyltransferase